MSDKDRDELLVRIDERLKGIHEALERDYKHLHGNGQPGLLTRVQKLEDLHANENRWTKKVAAVGAWLVSTGIAIFALSKHHN